MKLPAVDRIHPQSNKFAMGVDNEATGDSTLNDSPAQVYMMMMMMNLFQCQVF